MSTLGDIVVLIKPALNPEMIRSLPDGGVDFDNIPLKLSDIDRNAIEEANRLKEILKGKIYSITISTWGPIAKRDKDIKMAIQEGLAKGVDEAILLEDDAITPGDQVTTASAIVSILNKFNIKPDIILTGEATIDGFSGQVAGRVAAKLDLPYISFARKIDLNGNKVVAERDLEDYVEVVETQLPVVISVTREINSPKPPTLIQIRMASKKPQHVVKISELQNVTMQKKKLIEAKVLAVKRKQTMIEGKSLEEVADKLINILEQEGVLKH
ncbi:electron transfer flavoprotein, beta subunit [Caldisphaera lagunensis DSM 15908]|uniref:Electron transfer flavoprotein, beta subunit n=1 Tax=Caldisphaera lagunensis (strain DSM 15908 / JCM 11604 / ANMR 0165 / IC-154) TaxID=1056495 RepID=L0A8G1_CALLD|nr:electron transfer flavoprotein, beta subunit [Caldisphaera lagunensis DSM 15908]